jgi:hypothetical protein
MGDYAHNRQSSGGDVKNINVSQNVDADAIAQAVAKALGKMPGLRRSGSGEELEDDFNSEESLARLADSMIVQRSRGKSNFEDLGNVKETKRNSKDIDKTIDLLKDLD